MSRTPTVRPMPMPIDAPLEIPEWSEDGEGVEEEVDVEDIMKVVGVKAGGVILELVEVAVMLLGRISMLVSSD
jgi:hypothetical protein